MDSIIKSDGAIKDQTDQEGDKIHEASVNAQNMLPGGIHNNKVRDEEN